MYCTLSSKLNQNKTGLSLGTWRGDELYNYPIALTQQFKFCGNPFRIDLYKGCDFGCRYCFANSRNGNYNSKFDVANFEIIEKMFYKAFESPKQFKDINIELLRHKVPLHLGGMSDPFQQREFKFEITYKFLQLSNKYNYPVIISTKQSYLPDKYWSILNPKIHAFQISLMSYDEEYIRIHETNTPTAKDRISFMRDLKSQGFWVGLRVQPLINLKQVCKVINNSKYYIDFITVEHLKIPTDNKLIYNYYNNLVNIEDDYYHYGRRNYEVIKEIKIKNIEEIKKTTNLPIGVGDNDLHSLTQTRCCCGIDTIGENFSNWLKYNETYFVTGEKDDNIFIPKSSCRSCFNSDMRGDSNLVTVKDYVDLYMKKLSQSN